MSLYGHMVGDRQVNESVELSAEELQPYVEMVAFDDISRGDSDQVKEFCVSEAASVLLEKQVLNKKTLMRLSKSDDEKRRIKLVVYQLAKESKDSDWEKMCKYRKEWKHYRSKLMKRYGSRATKIAKAAQKEYINKARKAK